MTVTEERAAIGETIAALLAGRPHPSAARRAAHVGATRAMIAAARWCDDRTDPAERWSGDRWRESRRWLQAVSYGKSGAAAPCPFCGDHHAGGCSGS